MIELALFLSTFTVVFALGVQQQNVTGGHYWWAFFTSFVIGGAYLFLYKLVPDAGVSEMAAYLCGGPLGIVASMYVHRRIVRPKRNPQIPFAPMPKAPPMRVVANRPITKPHDTH